MLPYYQFWHQLAHDGVDFWEGSCRVLPLFGRLPVGGSGPSGAVHRAEDPQRVGLGLAGPCPQQQDRRIVRVELVPEYAVGIPVSSQTASALNSLYG